MSLATGSDGAINDDPFADESNEEEIELQEAIRAGAQRCERGRASMSAHISPVYKVSTERVGSWRTATAKTDPAHMHLPASASSLSLLGVSPRSSALSNNTVPVATGL